MLLLVQRRVCLQTCLAELLMICDTRGLARAIHLFLSWSHEPDDQSPKLHSSAKLGKLSRSVCTLRVSLQNVLVGIKGFHMHVGSVVLQQIHMFGWRCTSLVLHPGVHSSTSMLS